MTTCYLSIGLGAALLLCLQGEAKAAGDALRGKTLYKNTCMSCHSLDYNGIGPAHKDLFGRKAGSLPDYAYSAALQSSTIVWTEATLDKWLKNPAKLIPGEKMGFMVTSAKDRADLIAYLKKATVQK